MTNHVKKTKIVCACAGSPVENLVKSVKQHLRNVQKYNRTEQNSRATEKYRGASVSRR